MARELRYDQIRVNGIAPGMIRTDFAKPMLAFEEPLLEKLEVDRVGSVDDVANLAAFLGSDEASYINGETSAITGFVNHRL